MKASCNCTVWCLSEIILKIGKLSYHMLKINLFHVIFLPFLLDYLFFSVYSILHKLTLEPQYFCATENDFVLACVDIFTKAATLSS